MANDGLDDLMKAFDRVKKAPRDAVLKALTTSAESIASTQRALAPEDTGALKDSITVTLPGQSTPPYSQPGGNRVAGDNEIIVTAGNSDVRYPHLVEHGTAHASAQPFFGRASGSSANTHSNVSTGQAERRSGTHGMERPANEYRTCSHPSNCHPQPAGQ